MKYILLMLASSLCALAPCDQYLPDPELRWRMHVGHLYGAFEWMKVPTLEEIEANLDLADLTPQDRAFMEAKVMTLDLAEIARMQKLLMSQTKRFYSEEAALYFAEHPCIREKAAMASFLAYASPDEIKKFIKEGSILLWVVRDAVQDEMLPCSFFKDETTWMEFQAAFEKEKQFLATLR